MSVGGSEKFCLKWNEFESNVSTAFRELRDDKDFFDVTLACDGNQLEAHKVILSACSPFFRGVLKRNPHAHPLLYLKGIKYEDVLAVLNFMYHGEVNIAQDELNSFLAVAEDLQVKGLTQGNNTSSSSNTSPPTLPSKRSHSQDHIRPPKHVQRPPPPPRPSYEPPQQPQQPQQQSNSMEVSEVSNNIKTEPHQPIVLDLAEEDPGAVEEYGDEEEYQYGGQDYHYQEEMGQALVEGGAADAELPCNVWVSGDWHNKLKFSCDICLKSFSNKKSLQNHAGIHKGKTTCTVCNTVFSTTSNLNFHMRKIHNSSVSDFSQ